MYLPKRFHRGELQWSGKALQKKWFWERALRSQGGGRRWWGCGGSGEAKRIRGNPRVEGTLGAPGQLVLGMASSLDPTGQLPAQKTFAGTLWLRQVCPARRQQPPQSPPQGGWGAMTPSGTTFWETEICFPVSLPGCPSLGQPSGIWGDKSVVSTVLSIPD